MIITTTCTTTWFLLISSLMMRLVVSSRSKVTSTRSAFARILWCSGTLVPSGTRSLLLTVVVVWSRCLTQFDGVFQHLEVVHPLKMIRPQSGSNGLRVRIEWWRWWYSRYPHCRHSHRPRPLHCCEITVRRTIQAEQLLIPFFYPLDIPNCFLYFDRFTIFKPYHVDVTVIEIYNELAKLPTVAGSINCSPTGCSWVFHPVFPLVQMFIG